ncbi:MAG TPA: hypothetical protein ENN99_12555 [Chloroflexi bacterium]|nr:hypothetical protein [Chloroflexota bacterium]
MSQHPRRRDLLFLFGIALLTRFLVAVLIPRPGYMDAAYYAGGALRLAQGEGFSEPFLWHYLDDPAGLPRPGFLYWMPLPALWAAPGALLFPNSFLALQLPFVLTSALLPLMAYSVAWEVIGQRRAAWWTGLLTLFSGFFFPFWTLPETFAPFALFGGGALWLAGRGDREDGVSRYVLTGALVGLAHLTRADGVVLLPVVALAPLLRSRAWSAAERLRFVVGCWALLVGGYLVVMTPWFVRNGLVAGQPLPSAGAQTLWLRDYDDLFCYGCDLSFRSYLAWGWEDILRSKLYALWTNFQHLVAEGGQIFLFPLIVVGLYQLRRQLDVTLSLIYLVLLYGIHSLAFTFPGWRGSFFHSSSALLPFLNVAAWAGLDTAVRWLARRRSGWRARQAQAVFAVAALMGAVTLSLYVSVGKLPAWQEADAVYGEIGAWLVAPDEVDGGPVVMVGNPPGFYYHARMLSVVLPSGDVATLLAAADRYGVSYVVLDQNRPAGLAQMYTSAEAVGLDLVATFDAGRVQLYRRVGVSQSGEE